MTKDLIIQKELKNLQRDIELVLADITSQINYCVDLDKQFFKIIHKYSDDSNCDLSAEKSLSNYRHGKTDILYYFKSSLSRILDGEKVWEQKRIETLDNEKFSLQEQLLNLSREIHGQIFFMNKDIDSCSRSYQNCVISFHKYKNSDSDLYEGLDWEISEEKIRLEHNAGKIEMLSQLRSKLETILDDLNNPNRE